MSFFQIGLCGIVSVILLVLLRVPIAVALGIVSFFGFWAMLGSGAAFGLLTAVPYDFAAHWTLSSIPMFLLMGYVCYQTDITRGIFKAARVWLSFLPGGWQSPAWAAQRCFRPRRAPAWPAPRRWGGSRCRKC